MNTRFTFAALAGLFVSHMAFAADAPAAPAAAPLPLPAVIVTPPVSSSPDDEAKRAAAERYFATQDEDANFERLVAMLSGSLQNPKITPQQRQDFVDYARAHLDRTMLKNGMIGAMMETYSLPELEALAAFYSSSVGKQISAKNKQFQAAANQDVLPVAITFLSSYAAQCTDKSKCIDLSMMAKK